MHLQERAGLTKLDPCVVYSNELLSNATEGNKVSQEIVTSEINVTFQCL